MAEYEQEKYDSSIAHVNYAISLIPEMAYPYTTLAEANLLKGDLPEFYKAIEKAIELGFDLEPFLDEHPYNRLKDQSRIHLLISNYKRETALKD